MTPRNSLHKTVSINKAVNGFTVNVSQSTADTYKEKLYIAKTKQEAKKLASKFL